MSHNFQEVIDELHRGRELLNSTSGTQGRLDDLSAVLRKVCSRVSTYCSDAAQDAAKYLAAAQGAADSITGGCITAYNDANDELITRIIGTTGYTSSTNTEGKQQSDNRPQQVAPATPMAKDNLKIKADTKLNSQNNSTPQNRALRSPDANSRGISDHRSLTTRTNELLKLASIFDQVGVTASISIRLLLQKLAEIEENCFAESRIAYKKAAARAQKVNSIKQYKSKTTSSDHSQTLSGWSTRRPKGFHTPNDNDVLKVTEIISHPRRSSGCRDHGITGRAFASHCERQQALIAAESLIGVSRPLCRDCPGWFRKYSKHDGRIWYVTEPNGTWVFWHDGAVTMPDGTDVEPNEPIPGKYWN